MVDANFYELRTDLDDLIANPPTADSVVSVSQSGFSLTFHTTLGNALGPLTMPVVQFGWRGEWSPLTLYEAADTFIVTGTGLFTVMADHTSAATFDPDATGGSPAEALYNQLFGVGTNTTLDDLSDVSAGSPVAGQVLRYIGGSPDALWQPDMLLLDDLGDVSAAAPGDGDVLTYQAGSPTGWIASAPAAVPSTLDSLTDVSVPSPADGDFLRYQAGSPAGWINEAGTAISSLPAATLPLNTASLIEISEASGSPVTYDSSRITIANLLAAGNITLGSTAVALGATVTTIAGLTLSGGTLSGPVADLLGNATTISLANSSAYQATFFTNGSRLSIINTDSTNNNAAKIYFSSFNDAAAPVTFAALTTIFTSHAAGVESADVVFQTRSAGATSERFRIAGNNIGIGANFITKAPQANLHVGITAGTARIYNSMTDAANGEWAYLGSWGPTSNVATYGTDKNGTGATRNIQFYIGGTNKLDYGITVAGGWTTPDPFKSSKITTSDTAFMHNTSAALADGAAAQTGTLTNAPAAGNPTKWIPINDNGTTRYIPAW